MQLAEEALASGKADMVAMIRSFIADPDLVNKAKEGRDDEIRPCIRCCVCTGDDPHGCPKPIRCTVNAVAGRNMEFDPIPKAELSKEVVVVGGGCAGMEVARRLSERGHHPVILEKADRLGGNLWPAGDNALKGDIKAYREWSIHMTEKDPNIEIRLNTEVTRELISKIRPDTLVLAVGSEPIIPDIPGIKESHVVLAEDVDMGRVFCGENVIVVGAGLTGSETAVSLAQTGHKVKQIDMLTLEEIDGKSNASMNNIGILRMMSQQAGIQIFEKTRLAAIKPDGVICLNENNEEIWMECDTVVLSIGMRSRKATVEKFNGIVDETYSIGDCKSVGNITSAIRDAFYVAMNI